MLTYTISVSIRSTLLRYSLVLSEYLSNHSTCPDTRPDTINTRRPSVQLETYRPGIEANTVLAHFSYKAMRCLGKHTRCDFRTHAHAVRRSFCNVLLIRGIGPALVSVLHRYYNSNLLLVYITIKLECMYRNPCGG